jgi:osmotically-inducible protein OsmY
VVEITGFANSEEDRRKVVELVRGVEGVVKVKDEIVLLPEGSV